MFLKKDLSEEIEINCMSLFLMFLRKEAEGQRCDILFHSSEYALAP